MMPSETLLSTDMLRDQVALASVMAVTRTLNTPMVNKIKTRLFDIVRTRIRMEYIIYVAGRSHCQGRQRLV